MQFKVVGVVAMARHGKDTVANALVEKCGFTRISLADKLKEEVAEHYKGLPGFDLETLMHGEKGPVQRRVLQIWGTEGRRHIFPDFWIWHWCVKALTAATEGAPGVVQADVRFPNEAEYIKKVGGTLIGVDRGSFRDPDTDYEHESEIHIPDLLKKSDYMISNLGDFEDFHLNIEAAFRELGFLG
jgi:hypothetical protein